MKYNASRMAICTLLSAIKEGDLTASKRLLERKDIIGNLANIDYLDEDCDGTALFWACSKGLLDIVETLIANGADVDSRNAWGAAPLHGAADNNHCDIVRFLIKNGAKVDLTTINGDTPCHLAAYRGYIDVVKLLVDEGCDIWKENGDGSTALEEAKNRGHYHIVKFIRDLQYSGNIPKAPERSESPSPPAVSQYATIFPPTLQCKKRLQRSFIDLRACPSYTQAEHLQNSRSNSLSVDLGTLSSLSTSPTCGHLRQRLNHGNISISEGNTSTKTYNRRLLRQTSSCPMGCEDFSDVRLNPNDMYSRQISKSAHSLSSPKDSNIEPSSNSLTSDWNIQSSYVSSFQDKDRLYSGKKFNVNQ